MERGLYHAAAPFLSLLSSVNNDDNNISSIANISEIAATILARISMLHFSILGMHDK